jgi:hypothetical protein
MAKMASLHADLMMDFEEILAGVPDVDFTPEQLAAIALYIDLAE